MSDNKGSVRIGKSLAGLPSLQQGSNSGSGAPNNGSSGSQGQGGTKK